MLVNYFARALALSRGLNNVSYRGYDDGDNYCYISNKTKSLHLRVRCTEGLGGCYLVTVHTSNHIESCCLSQNMCEV